MAFADPFFDGMAGEWQLTGEIMGKPLEQMVSIRWILEDRYLQIHYQPSTVTPLSSRPYEAIAIVGYDPGPDRYSMFLFDTFGGGYSPPGFGEVLGGVLEFRFDYDKGPFLAKFTREGDDWLIEQRFQDASGDWRVFGIKRLKRSA